MSILSRNLSHFADFQFVCNVIGYKLTCEIAETNPEV